MLNTCSAHFQQASLVCKHTCSHRKATCPRPGSAFVHGRKELRAVCGSTKPCRGQAPPAGAEPAAGILHCLQQATRRPSHSLTPDQTVNVPFTLYFWYLKQASLAATTRYEDLLSPPFLFFHATFPHYQAQDICFLAKVTRKANSPSERQNTARDNLSPAYLPRPMCAMLMMSRRLLLHS